MMNSKYALFLPFILLFNQETYQQTIYQAPSYAVAGPGALEPAELLCTFDVSSYPDQVLHFNWVKGGSVTLLTFDNTPITSDRYQSRIVVDGDIKKITLNIFPVHLEDQGMYYCQLSGENILRTGSVNLSVSQLPAYNVTTLKKNVLEGEENTIAICHANLSKPAPEMWYEDSTGERIDTGEVATVHACGKELVNASLSFTRTFYRNEVVEEYFCKIKHPNRTQPYQVTIEKVDVLYPPIVRLLEISSSSIVLRHGMPFTVSCIGEGNPKPEILWTFIPDPPIDGEMSNETRTNFEIPSNFIINGNQISTGSVLSGVDETVSNNGTFTCTATNGVSPDAVISVSLKVKPLPPTTPPPTTTAAFLEISTDSSASKKFVAVEATAEPRRAGPSAAVIAGVVAVAAFVLIVTVILLLRYFMGQKGEYYTNELQPEKVEVLCETDEEEGLPCTEADLLGEKKRKEHFL